MTVAVHGHTPPRDPLPEAESDRVVQRLRAARDRVRKVREELDKAAEAASGLPLAYLLGPKWGLAGLSSHARLLEESLEILEGERHAELVAREEEDGDDSREDP